MLISPRSSLCSGFIRCYFASRRPPCPLLRMSQWSLISSITPLPPPEQALSRITPVSGPAEAAGTAVTFYGRGFVNTTGLACRFGLAPPVPATFVSPNELFCESPPLFSAVGQNGTDGDGTGGLMWSSLSEIWQEEQDPLTGSRQLFPGAHYHPLFSQRPVGVEVCRAAVASGVCITGCFSSDWSCIGIDLRACWRWFTLLVFQIDTIIFKKKDRAVRTSVRTEKRWRLGRVTTKGVPSTSFSYVLLRRGTKYTQQVTCNGQDYTDSGTTFLYQADASVSNVSLSAGLDPGDFGLFVAGEGFVNSTSLSCRIGGSNTPATFLSSDVVLCFVPRGASASSIRGYSAEEAAAAIAETEREGSGVEDNRGFGPREGGDGSSPAAWLGPLDGEGKALYVEVSNNGLDFTADRVTYTVEQACPGGSFCVGPGAAAILPCPQVARKTGALFRTRASVLCTSIPGAEYVGYVTLASSRYQVSNIYPLC